MAFTIQLENAIRQCNAENITLHPEGDWAELRLQGVHPVLRVRSVDDCVFRRHIIGKLQSHFRDTESPILVCGNRYCIYYSGSEVYRAMDGGLEESVCRVLRGGVSRDEMFLSKGLRALASHYLETRMGNLDFGSRDAIELARFMGFDTALYPPDEADLTKRYLLFRWISLYLLYRITTAFKNDPVMLPVTEDPGQFLAEMWQKYYSHLQGMSDVRMSLGSLDSPDFRFLSSWDHLPAFAADIHWVTSFTGGTFMYYHLLPVASFVGESESDLLMDTAHFVSGENVAIFTSRFGLSPLYVYRMRRLAGMEHPEAVRGMSVFTSPGAGEVFQSILLNLAGEGVPYKPTVRGVKAPPMRWEEFSALLGRSLEDKPFSTVLMDWRGRDDLQGLISSIDYLWDVSSEKIILILDAIEKNMKTVSGIFESNRVKVVITHRGNGAVSFVLTGRGIPSRNYTKLVRFKEPLEEDMVDAIENAENRLDSNMIRLNIPVRGARFFYYRDSTMWLLASLQEKFMKWGGPLLSLIPGYVWKALSQHRWILLKDLARIHVGDGKCPSSTGKGILWISSRGTGRSEGVSEAISLTFALMPGKETFRIIPVDGRAVLCEGGIGLQVKDKDRERLLKWFLRSRMAYSLYKIFGINDLPVPDLMRFEGDPDRFFAGKGEDLNDMAQVVVRRTTISDLIEVLDRYTGNGDYEHLRNLLEERVFDEKLRERLMKTYWKKKHGELPQETRGGRLF